MVAHTLTQIRGNNKTLTATNRALEVIGKAKIARVAGSADHIGKLVAGLPHGVGAHNRGIGADGSGGRRGPRTPGMRIEAAELKRSLQQGGKGDRHGRRPGIGVRVRRVDGKGVDPDLLRGHYQVKVWLGINRDLGGRRDLSPRGHKKKRMKRAFILLIVIT